jgi:hypothetical protein
MFKPSRLVGRHRCVASSPTVLSPTPCAPKYSRSVRPAGWIWSLVLWVVVALSLRGTTAVLHSHEGEAAHLHVLLGAVGEHHDHHHVHEHEHEPQSFCAAPCGDDQLEFSLPQFEATRLTATVRLAVPVMVSPRHSTWMRAESEAAGTSARHVWKPLVDAPPRRLQGGVAALLVSSKALLL